MLYIPARQSVRCVFTKCPNVHERSSMLEVLDTRSESNDG